MAKHYTSDEKDRALPLIREGLREYPCRNRDDVPLWGASLGPFPRPSESAKRTPTRPDSCHLRADRGFGLRLCWSAACA
jgi:hypothetical protein